MRKVTTLNWDSPDVEIYSSSYYYHMNQYDIQVMHLPRVGRWRCVVIVNGKFFIEPVTYDNAEQAAAWFRLHKFEYKRLGAA
jgi:hypothetical protein